MIVDSFDSQHNIFITSLMSVESKSKVNTQNPLWDELRDITHSAVLSPTSPLDKAWIIRYRADDIN